MSFAMHSRSAVGCSGVGGLASAHHPNQSTSSTLYSGLAADSGCRNTYNCRKQTLRKAQAGISQHLERLTEAYLMAIIPMAEYQRRRSELEQKSQALEAQTKELEAQVNRQAELVQLGSSIEDFCRRIHAGLLNATFDQKRAMVELLIDRVLMAEGEVEIRYVVPTHPNSEKVRFCHLRKDYFDDVV
jgi:site-specific DNA recombinase